ncbi:4198_t:CDS:2, partial [Entrophospora sp. SA101]
TVLSERHYTDNLDVDVVGEIMRVYPTEAACGNVILNAYSYYPYYKQTMKLYQENFDKTFKQNQEYEEKIQQLEAKQEELEARVEEFEERVDIEVEMNLKALKSAEWGEKQLKE